MTVRKSTRFKPFVFFGTSMFTSKDLKAMAGSLMVALILLAFPTSLKAATCPTTACDCRDATSSLPLRVIDCRNKGLTEIPTFIKTSERFYEITFKNSDGCSNCNTIKSLSNAAFSNITLERIDFSGVRLNSISDGAFQGLELSLVKLDIEGDKIIPPPLTALNNLTKLVTLELKNFMLVSLNGDTFGSYPELTTLTMKDMNIDVIQQTTFYSKFPKLTTLNIIGNPVLTNIPVGALRHLPTLQHLSLVQNGITQVTSKAFEVLVNLISLDLSHNIINILDSDCFNGLYNKLETLLLHLNNLESNDLGAISTPTWTKLHQLNLGNNRISDIPDGLFKNMPNIAYINLVSNSFTSLTTADFEGTTSLTHLDLSYNKIDFIQERTFSQMTHLTELDFQDNHETSPNKKFNFTFEVIMGIHSSLERLNLMNTKVIENEFWRALKYTVKLKSLIVKNAGLTAIPDYTFQDLSLLSFLDVSENQISLVKQETFFGLEASMDSLNLQKNSITTINECVFRNFTLMHYFYLNDNPLNCDCQLKWIKTTLQSKPPQDFYLWNGNCNTPASLKGKSVTTVDSNLLVCAPGYTAPKCKDLSPLTTESPQTTTESPTTTVNLPTITAFSLQTPGLFSVGVTWSVSDNTLVKQYRVTYENKNTGTKLTSDPISKSNVQFTLDQLTSATLYDVCLVTELSISSVVSPKCSTITTLQAPAITVGIVSKSTDRIRISWSVTMSSYVERYSVKYEKLGDSSTSKTVPVDKSKTDLTIESLDAGFSYEVCVTVILDGNRSGSKRCTQQATDEKAVTEASTSGGSNAGIIAGAVVGCIFAIAVVVFIIYFLVFRRSKSKDVLPPIQTTNFMQPGSLPHIPNDARRFVKTKGKDGEPGDAIQIQTVSGKMDPNDPRISGGSYQFLNENSISLEPMSSGGKKLAGANGTAADLPPPYNYVNHGYNQQSTPAYVNYPKNHPNSNPSHGAYINDNDMRPLPRVPAQENSLKNGGSSLGFTNTGFKKETPATSPTTPTSQNVYHEIPL